ncbi:lysylphosphatidylglycerol synthase transmembrane domain-containing protein [Paenibacillus harenae]|uniref:lysylphosphatidylglycerol synthase transmembrane domain-containing protein n=1 Tax=Paenibacillus harenae TaxID=306543 RepID=UPI00040C8399|nr:lysylphosphatidylglycerol synthase transmembrane domain-containing protein [Paenibacillus harenae]
MSIKWIMRLSAIALLAVFIWMTWRWFDKDQWLGDLLLLVKQPQWLMFMFTAYLLSFALKAEAWRRYTGANERFSIFFHGIIYSLLINHLLPLKVGDIVRTGFLKKMANKTWDEALYSVTVMRLLDMLVLCLYAGAGIVWLGLPSSWLWVAVLLAAAVLLAVCFKLPVIKKIPLIQKHLAHFKATMLSGKGLFIMAALAVSWILEAGVIFGISSILGLNLGAVPLVWANSMTIAGQVFHITPGGIGTYESTLSGSLAVLGINGREAYGAAILSHAFKFVFAFGMGAYSLLRMPLGWREARIWIKERRTAKE